MRTLAEELGERLNLKPDDPRFELSIGILSAVEVLRHVHDDETFADLVEHNLKQLLEMGDRSPDSLEPQIETPSATH